MRAPVCEQWLGSVCVCVCGIVSCGKSISLYMFACVYKYFALYMSVSLSVCLSVCLFVCVCLSVCQPACLSVCLGLDVLFSLFALWAYF